MNRFMVVLFSVIVVALFPVIQCNAAPVAPIVYVAGDGSGDYNCDGTADDVEIRAALRYVATNDEFTTVYLKGPFTYDISNSLLLDSNTILEGDSTAVLKRSAAADMIRAVSAGRTNITIRGFSIEAGDYGAHVISLGASWKNITINDMKINGNIGNKKFAIAINPGSMPSELANIRIFNNTITNFMYGAIELGNIDGVEIYSNNFTGADLHYPLIMRITQVNNLKIYDNVMCMQSVGAAGIQMNYNSNSNVVIDSVEIYNNQFIDIITAGVLLNGIEAGAGRGRAENVHIHHNIFRYNGVSNSTFGGGVTVNGFDKTLIEYNVFDSCGGAAIKSAKVSETPVRAEPYITFVRNNIIVNSWEHSSGGTGNAVYNKLNASHTFVIDNNCVHNNTGENYLDVTANTSLEADPLFADPDNYDYHLKSQAGRWNGTTWVIDNEHSPCIDAGYSDSDFDNEPAPNGSRVNIGLYGNTEYASKSMQ